MWATRGDYFVSSLLYLKNDSCTEKVFVWLSYIGPGHQSFTPYSNTPLYHRSWKDLLLAGLQSILFQSSNLHEFCDTEVWWQTGRGVCAAMASDSFLVFHNSLCWSPASGLQKNLWPSQRLPPISQFGRICSTIIPPTLPTISKHVNTLSYIPFCLKYVRCCLFSWLTDYSIKIC